jgi:hypothetical protein
MAQPNQPGAPEGMRAAGSHRVRFSGPLAAIALLCTLIAVAISDETTSLIVANSTRHVVNIVVADRTFADIAPGARATYVSSGAKTVSARVTYAPGQGIEGGVERSFALAPYQAASSSDYSVYFACTTGRGITSPASGGPVTWSVTADTLAAH